MPKYYTPAISRWKKAHRVQLLEQDKKRRERNHAAGLCVHCKVPVAIIGARLCELHYVRQIACKRTGNGTMVFARQLLDKFEKQGRVCPYTGVHLVLANGLCQLDHILPVSRFPEFRSEISNLEFVSCDINFAKRAMTRDEFLTMCQTVCEHTRGISNGRGETIRLGLPSSLVEASSPN